MSTENLTVEILKQIRADLAETNRSLRSDMAETNRVNQERMQQIEARQAASDQRIEATQSRLVEAEIRLATELITVSKTIGEVRDLLRDRLDQRDRVDDHERRIDALERKPSPRGSRPK